MLVKVANIGFCGSDHFLIKSGVLPDGCLLGDETSGVVAEKAKDVRSHKPGEGVIIRPTFWEEEF